MEGGLIEEGKFYRINKEILFIEGIDTRGGNNNKMRLYRSDKDSFQKPHSAEFTGASYPPELSDTELDSYLACISEKADFIESRRTKESQLVEQVSTSSP